MLTKIIAISYTLLPVIIERKFLAQLALLVKWWKEKVEGSNTCSINSNFRHSQINRGEKKKEKGIAPYTFAASNTILTTSNSDVSVLTTPQVFRFKKKIVLQEFYSYIQLSKNFKIHLILPVSLLLAVKSIWDHCFLLRHTSSLSRVNVCFLNIHIN